MGGAQGSQNRLCRLASEIAVRDDDLQIRDFHFFPFLFLALRAGAIKISHLYGRTENEISCRRLIVVVVFGVVGRRQDSTLQVKFQKALQVFISSSYSSY